VANRASLNLTEQGIVAPEVALPKAIPGREQRPMDARACRQYADDMRGRYARADRRARGCLLDEFTAVTAYHRKYAIALLGRKPAPRVAPRGRPSRFSPPVVSALVAIWRSADYPWSRRLAALLPLWMPYARKHLKLTPELEGLLLGMSPRSIDRVLRAHRTGIRRRLYGRTKPGTLLKHQVPIRSERWDTTEVGWCETDTVAHCGDSGEGEFAFSVNLTDVASTWTETRAVLGKGQRFVVEALEEMRTALPFALRGLDSDSGSEFVNRHCVDWCSKQGLLFTRSRPYHKNDNAYVEQKNWTHVRKIFGWKRLDSAIMVTAMNELYSKELRLLMNYFQPSVKLIERSRIGSRVRRKYDRPKTPFQRLVELQALTSEQIAAMTSERERLDPFILSATVEAKVRRVLSMRTAPLSKPRPRGTPLATWSRNEAKRRASLPEPLVRSYVAR